MNRASLVLDTTDELNLSLFDVHLGHLGTTNAHSAHGWNWTCSVDICKDRLADVLTIITCSCCILLSSHSSRITALLLVLTSPSISRFLLSLHRAIHVGLWVAKSLLAGIIENRSAALVFSHTTQLVIQVPTIDLTVCILSLIDSSTLVVQGVVAEVLVTKSIIVHGSHIATIISLRSKVRRNLAIHRLGPAAST